MKKAFYLSAAAVAALGLVSCSNEDMPLPGNDGSTVIKVQLPADLNTRADGVYFGDGKLASKLYVAVYESGSQQVLFSNFPSDGDTYSEGLTVTDFDPSTLTASVKVNLVKSMSYDFVFWAANPDMDDVYTYTSSTQTVKVDYDAMANYSETRDAFYNHKTVTPGTTNVDVTLYRPFAQINIGTSDFEDYKRAGGSASTLFGMTVTNVQNTLNLMTGSVGQDNFDGNVTVAGAMAPPQKDGQTVPFTVDPATYDYLAMGFVLVGDQGVNKSNLQVALTLDGKTLEPVFANIPAQMNYRTNIFGALLTNPAEFKVTIDSAFEQPDYNVGYRVWDGTSTAPVIDEATKSASINTPQELAGLAELVNNGNNYNGYTFTLNADMDLDNRTWTPVGKGTRFGSAFAGTAFGGTFDGNGKTIKGLNPANVTAANNAAGLFAAVSGTVKNLTLEDVAVNQTNSEQTGAVTGILVSGGVIDNVNVTSGSVHGTEGVGAIVGRVMIDGTVSNCSNAAAVTGSKYNVGGIVGAAYYTAKGKEMHITGCKNTGTITANGVSTGGIVGFSTAFVSGCSNYGKVTGMQNSVGGIVGTQRTAGGVSDCHNYADITGNPNGNNAALGVGGVVGWVTYQGPAYSYPNRNVITIENCTNSGNITAVSSPTGANSYAAGGIVGLWYNMGTVKGCTNNATSIKAQTMTAGIIGSSQWLASADGLPENAEEMLYVTNNTTTTTLDRMTGVLKALLVYVNNADKITFSGNTPASND